MVNDRISRISLYNAGQYLPQRVTTGSAAISKQMLHSNSAPSSLGSDASPDASSEVSLFSTSSPSSGTPLTGSLPLAITVLSLRKSSLKLLAPALCLNSSEVKWNRVLEEEAPLSASAGSPEDCVQGADGVVDNSSSSFVLVCGRSDRGSSILRGFGN